MTLWSRLSFSPTVSLTSTVFGADAVKTHMDGIPKFAREAQAPNLLSQLNSSSFKELGSRDDVQSRFTNFYLTEMLDAVESLLWDGGAEGEALPQVNFSVSLSKVDFSFPLSLFNLVEFDPILAHGLVLHYKTMLVVAQFGLIEAQKRFLLHGRQGIIENLSSASSQDLDEAGAPSTATSSVKGINRTRLHIRLTDVSPLLSATSLADMNPVKQMSSLVAFEGVAVKIEGKMMLEKSKTFKCLNQRCGVEISRHADYEREAFNVDLPSKCQAFLGSESDDGSSGEEPSNRVALRCNSTSWRCTGTEKIDYQELRLQEPVSRLSVGEIPRSITVILEHDLVKCVLAGDRVHIVGALQSRWGNVKVGDNVRGSIKSILRANSITDNRDGGAGDHAWGLTPGGGNSNSLLFRNELREEFDRMWSDSTVGEMTKRNSILKAVCPKLCGMDMIKLGLLLTLIGGVGEEVGSGEGGNAGGDYEDLEETGDGDGADFSTPTEARGAAANDGPIKFWDGKAAAKNNQYLRKVASANNGGREGGGGGGGGGGGAGGAGASVVEGGKMKRRSQSHLMLLGDPGIGKSDFLK